MTVKVGKAVAIAVGGSIILLQIANDQGYINVNWDKLATKTDKLMDKVEERVTGEGPNMLDKVCGIHKSVSLSSPASVRGLYSR